jgi:uncharacterized membrane protein YjfL (UPF0719 family)
MKLLNILETGFEAIPITVIYAVIGILIALLAYQIIDWITPGRLSKKISEEGNIALGIVVGALMLGICIIIDAAIAG